MSRESGHYLDQELERCVAFAGLAAEWFWELDDELRFSYLSSNPMLEPAGAHHKLLGRSRISVMLERHPHSGALLEHNRLLEAQQPIDMVLPLHEKDAPPCFVRVFAQPRYDSEGRFIGYYGCGRDVTESVLLRQQLAHIATRDELTGLFNRREFLSRLKLLHSFVQETEHEFSLCILDLDRFKLVNDTAGHAAGDQMLKDLTELMREQLDSVETVARLGGDEFGFLLESDSAAAVQRMQLIIESINDYVMEWDGRPYSVGACVGITPLKHRCGTVEQLTDRADSACYAAKYSGRNQCVVFAEDSPTYIAHRRGIAQVEMIREALRASRLQLFVQAIEPASGPGSSSHYEVLLRLRSLEGELLMPATFIPVAERYNIMQDLDIQVLEQSLEIMRNFDRCAVENTCARPISLSINLSVNTLSDQDALDRIVSTVLSCDVSPQRLCFEITESAAISNIDRVVAFMQELKSVGVRFALDDFGAGLSSFGYIRSMPIDFLKIDGYFIRNIRADETNRAITASFIQLSHKLGIATVAEFVEDKATRKAVANMGVDYVQGYGVARPRDVEAVLADHRTAELPFVANG